ncbi:MAG: YdcF family protein [Ferruginibacter sp.]
MHEFASALLTILLSPINWIIFVVIIQFITKTARTKRICRLTALTIFILFGNTWLLTLYARLWDAKAVNLVSDKSYSCGIVLGGFASPDENGNGYFNSTCDRFIETIKLYKLGKIKHILISGGNGKKKDEQFTEGEWAKQQMNIMGIPDSVIFCEDRSNNTADNAVNTKRLLDSLSLKPPYLLVTSAYHIRRAALLFKDAGVVSVSYPCNYIAGKDRLSVWGIIPDPENLLHGILISKKAVAYSIYYLREKIK